MSSENTQFIISELKKENEELSKNNSELIPEQVGIARTYVTSYEKITKVLDQNQDIFTIINQINQKKQQIVTLCAKGLGDYEPGLVQPTCDLASEVGNLDTNVVSETGEIPSEITTRTISGSTTSITTPKIAFGVVRKDSIRVQFYPRLENQEAPTNNALENSSYPILQNINSSFVGKGKGTLLFQNSKYSEGQIDIFAINDSGEWDSISWSQDDQRDDTKIGNYYKITGGGSNCSSWASSIEQLESEITILRNQLSDILVSINGFKNKKHGYQLRVWAAKRTEVVNNDTIRLNNSMRRTLKNPPFTS